MAVRKGGARRAQQQPFRCALGGGEPTWPRTCRHRHV